MRSSQSRKFWLMGAGYLIAFVLWYASVKWMPVAAFARLPDPVTVLREWFAPDPAYGISIFTGAYYKHIMASTLRVLAAFTLAVGLGVPFGILMGWSARFNAYASALIGVIRPIPPLAWVPLAILLLPAAEAAVVYVTFLVAFFATTLNTLVGVRAIDPDYLRAARCLGGGQPLTKERLHPPHPRSVPIRVQAEAARRALRLDKSVAGLPGPEQLDAHAGSPAELADPITRFCALHSAQ